MKKTIDQTMRLSFYRNVTETVLTFGHQKKCWQKPYWKVVTAVEVTKNVEIY